MLSSGPRVKRDRVKLVSPSLAVPRSLTGLGAAPNERSSPDFVAVHVATELDVLRIILNNR